MEFLPVGPYKVSVVATGFKTLDRSGVVLSVMQSATLDLVLQIGGQSETVNVTADVPLVNLSNATLGSSVSNVQIDNLPLISRDTYACSALFLACKQTITQTALDSLNITSTSTVPRTTLPARFRTISMAVST